MKVFVYGTLKSDQSAADLMYEGGELIGPATTIDLYRMYNFGGFPGVTYTHLPDPCATVIHGEVWEIREDHMPRLHAYEGYRASDPEGSLYIPKEIETTLGYATMYMFNDIPFTNSIVHNGLWSRRK